MSFKIQASEPGSTKRQDVMSYENPNNTYDTAEDAEAAIMKIRNRPYNLRRRFYVTEVIVSEATLTIVEPVLMPEEKPDLDFTVIDNREMGIRGSV